MKKKYLFLFLAVCGIAAFSLRASNSDKWNLTGEGQYNGKDMVHVDSTWNMRLFNGSLYLGDSAMVPSTGTASTSLGGQYGVKVPFYNGSSSSTAVGSVMVAFATMTTVTANMVAITATTTVMGVSDGVYTPGSMGWMTISGYALVLTTGAVHPGDILVSSATTGGSGALATGYGYVGYAGVTTGTEVVGTAIGKALTNGTAAGGTVLALINLQ